MQPDRVQIYETDAVRRRMPDETLIARFAPLGAVAAMLLILLLLGALLYLVDRDERAADQEQLIRDVLWVEQALQFQFDSEGTRLLRLAKDIADGEITPEAFVIQARQYALILPDIVSVTWLETSGRVVAAVPSPEDGFMPPAANLKMATILALAHENGAGAFSAPFRRRDGSAAIAFVAPILRDHQNAGVVVATFALDLVLTHQVPWWIAEKRAVLLKDATGGVIAQRSRIKPKRSAPSHTIEMGSPLRDLQLELASFRERRGLAHNGLVVAMAVLGLLAAGGLVARERQIRRRRAAEAALEEEHAFRRAMENSLLVGIRARDLDGKLLYANQAFCRMVGYSLDELVGHTAPMPYWVPEQIEYTQRIHDQVMAGQQSYQAIELQFQRKDGTRIDVLIYEAPLVDTQGVQRGWMGSVLDISDRKRAEAFARAQAEKMQHTARLVTMGEMASMLAHDLSQPLAAIRSYQAGLANGIAAGDLDQGDVKAGLDGIGRSAERASLIVRRIHDFAKKSEPHFETLRLEDILAEAMALLGPELQRVHVLLDAHIQPMLPAVRADRVLIEQVIVNLMRNGIEAMAAVPGDRRLDIELRRTRRGMIGLSVTDGGAGVAPALADALFQPFISTKQGGMGMGLSICRSILELHGGSISYRPGELGGSRFTFELPTQEA